jgi:hypothetical protein
VDLAAILGAVAGFGVLAGIRLYAAVLVAGLLIRFEWIRLPDHLSQLSVLAHPWVLAAAGFAFLIEMAADKVPYLDSFWDAIHTVIRPVGAALIGLAAAGSLSPVWHVILFLLGGGVALTTHAAKASTRAAVNASPEPFSNVLISAIEDILAAAGAWLVIAHPVLALCLAAVLLIVFALILRKMYHFLRERIRRGWAWLTA